MIQNNNSEITNSQSLQMAVGSSAFSLLECLDIENWFHHSLYLIGTYDHFYKD